MAICEIEGPGQTVRLPGALDKVPVECPLCGCEYEATPKHARRIQAGEFTGICKACRRPEIRVRESDRRYWLTVFGCALDGRSAAEYVRDEGLPAELQELCDELGGFLTHLELAA